jgi:hypothetical protein
MLSRRLVPAFTSLVVVSSLLAFLSCDIDAKQEQKPSQSAKASGPYRPGKCCQAGYLLCPTGGPQGCDCCGVSVQATLKNYQKKQGNKDGLGQLTIANLNGQGKDGEVDFVVVNDGVDGALSGMVGKAGQFVIKLKTHEYKLPAKNMPPHDNPNLQHWHETRFECEQIGNDAGNGKQMEDRTKEFIDGWNATGTILDVRAQLEALVPSYPPERDKDDRK